MPLAAWLIAADNGFAVDGIQPTARLEVYFLGFSRLTRRCG